MLKTAGSMLVKPLLKVFNLCLDTGYYPDEWCLGHIVPIYKSGNKGDVKNYRPITVSSCLGKLFSLILNDRLQQFLETNNLISNAQIGFRKGHRTSDHILLLKALIDSYKQKKKHIYACFVDFSSAFDSIWHQGLIYKMYKNGFSNKIIKLLQSMYNKIQSCVKKQGVISESFNCNKGTRQGCSLSPTLFNIYVNDLEKCINSEDCDPVKVGQQATGCLMYADDILILSQSANGLQKSLNRLHIYCNKWKLHVNTKKTKIMVFNSRKFHHTFTIGNQVVQQVDSILYLGFMLTPSGKFNAMQKYLYNKSCRALFALRSALRGSTWLTVNTQLKLFDAVIKPIMLYGCEVWGAYLFKYKNNLDSLNSMLKDVNILMEKLHTKVCKKILQVHKNANNYAVRCELGRYPLFINVMSRLINYYINICDRDKHSLVLTALDSHKSTKDSWFQFLKYIVKTLGIKMPDNPINTRSICNKLLTLTNDVYIKKLKEYSSLNSYTEIKSRVCREKYLSNVQHESHRKALTCLRLGCNKFPIVTGRYNKLKQSDRVCTKCKMTVGTEYHCIMECFDPQVTNLRNDYLTTIFNINTTLKCFNRPTLFKYITLLTDKTILNASSKFIYEITNMYK